MCSVLEECPSMYAAISIMHVHIIIIIVKGVQETILKFMMELTLSVKRK